MARKLTQEEFIERAKEKHEGYYSYDKSVFTKYKDKLIITCPIHGDFLQMAGKHLSGQGCEPCRRKASRDYKRITPEKFLEKAVVRHKNLYNYGEINCTSSKDFVEIICSEHGSWMQNVNNHLMGQECPTCAGKNITTADMIERFKIIHNNVYDYSLVEYVNALTSVKIICARHGEFEQMPYTHLDGSGCPDCAEHGFRKNKLAVLYVYDCTLFVGFGITNDFETRQSRHNTNFKRANINSELIYSREFSGMQASILESEIKQHFKKSIIDTGIEGFKTEALPIEYLPELLNFIESKTP